MTDDRVTDDRSSRILKTRFVHQTKTKILCASAINIEPRFIGLLGLCGDERK